MDIAEKLTASLSDRYRVERELGAGGMAVVYLAQDLKHDRKVALKVLRPELAAILGGDRFLHEIRTTANLQHPHILPLHDSGEVEGTVFYVMPFVDGESLRDRLNREKQLPLDDAVRIAREIADALEYAHTEGVVHRDIKPENILLHGGHAMVADFGIALAVSQVGGGTRMTETGMSLGTPHYMAPEQAMGDREITARADIYALGCVTYEMLTGGPPFTGATAQAIVARVVTENPRLLTVQRHTIPRHVEAAVLKCLEKLPADRFASAAGFSRALGDSAFVGNATLASQATSARVRWESRVAAASLAIALVATTFGAWAFHRRGAEEAVSRYGLTLPPSQAPRIDRMFALAPDGSRLVYVGPGATAQQTQLWVKERDRFDAEPVGGTEGVSSFTLSPDGQWIAFVQANRLKKVAVTGGAAITLADSAGNLSALAWMDDGQIVFTRIGTRELLAVSSNGGSFTSVLELDSMGPIQAAPVRGTDVVLYVRCRGGRCGTMQDLWAIDLSSRETKLVQPGVAMARYVPTGHLVLVRRDGALLGAAFDPGSMELRGAPVPLLDSVSLVNEMYPLMDVSSNGTLVARYGLSMSSRDQHEMVWVDRTGRESLVDSGWSFRLTVAGGNVGWSLSPDGTRLAVGLNSDAGDDIWVKQLPDGPASRITFDSMPQFRPRWDPAGTHVLYTSGLTGPNALMRRRGDGTGSEEVVLSGGLGVYESQMTPDGQWVLARTGGSLGLTGGRNVMARRLGGDTATVPLLVTSFDEAAIALSPNGRLLAYESNETGRTEVYLRPFPEVQQAKWQVSDGGGVAPLWDRSGRELYYVNGNREMVTRSVTMSGAVVQLGQPRMLFRLRDDIYLADPENYTPFDIGRDGRFLMARRLRSSAAVVASQLIVAEHWFSELRERVTP